MTKTDRIFINSEAAEEVMFHLDSRLIHVSYVWKGGERTGKYHLYDAKQCDAKTVCTTAAFPDDWRISNAEKPKMIGHLKRNKIRTRTKIDEDFENRSSTRKLGVSGISQKIEKVPTTLEVMKKELARLEEEKAVLEAEYDQRVDVDE